MKPNHAGRSPGSVQLHENLTLLETDGAEQMHDLQLLPEVRAATVRRLDPCTAVIDARRLPPMLEALRKHGHLPRVLDGDPEG